MLLKDRVAIVTGAAEGIGREYAKVLAANGAAVAVADLNLKCARQTADEIIAAGGGLASELGCNGITVNAIAPGQFSLRPRG